MFDAAPHLSKGVVRREAYRRSPCMRGGGLRPVSEEK